MCQQCKTDDHSNAQSGFTLVELLVVIAIVGVLVALLLPAIQAAREAGRRNSCSNNLRQIGLALQSFHDGREHFPSGRGPTTDEYGVTWAFELLPFVEASVVFNSFDKSQPVHASVNAIAMRTPVSVYFCPSRRAPIADRDFPDLAGAERGVAAAGDYASSAGLEAGFRATQLLPGGAFEGEDFGVVAGVMHTFSEVAIRQVIDGLSNTIAVGGRHIPPVPGNLPPEEQHLAIGDVAFFSGNKSGTAMAGSDDGIAAYGDAEVAMFGSEHPQICQFVYLDGHVRSIRKDVAEHPLEWLSTISDGHVVEEETL